MKMPIAGYKHTTLILMQAKCRIRDYFEEVGELKTVSLPKISSGTGTLGYWLGVPFWGYGYAVEAQEG